MILNQAQADAVYSAMCALNNAGSYIRGFVEVSDDINVKVLLSGGIQVWNLAPNAESGFESFSNQAAFATAYGLQ